MKRFKPKTKKAKIIFFSSLAGIFVVSCIAMVMLLLLARIDYSLSENPTYEINTENTISTLFSRINSGTLEASDAKLDTSEIGEKRQTATIISNLGTKQSIEIIYHIVDTTSPEITGESELSFKTDDEVDLLDHFKATDNSGKQPTLSVEGDYDLTKPNDYPIKITAKDESGNASSLDVILKIFEAPRPVTVAKATTSGAPYYIEVNRQQNVVIVYSKDRNDNYTNIVKVFVASTGAPGAETPLGVFTTSDRYETLYLVGNVWGHYTMRITGPIFFHSVPYFTKGAPWDNLEYLEYNKLGSGASAGCVRLTTSDAKWIYDNIGYGTTVKIYDSVTLPAGVVKPSAVKIDENNPNRGWDPTDPDPNNPWH